MTEPAHERDRGVTPVEELRQTIVFAIWHATDRELGCQTMFRCPHDCCTERASLDIEQWKREHDDSDLQVRRHLTALRFAVGAGQDARSWAMGARRAGASWEQLGDALGVTRQAAQHRFGV